MDTAGLPGVVAGKQVGVVVRNRIYPTKAKDTLNREIGELEFYWRVSPVTARNICYIRILVKFRKNVLSIACFNIQSAVSKIFNYFQLYAIGKI